MDSSRKTAFDVLLKMEEDGAFSNIALNRYIRGSKPDNPAFVREIVYGVTANRILIDYYLDRLISSGINKVKAREKTLLRMGIEQILFESGVPDYAAVNETVTMASKLCKGRQGFINGVLRGYLKKRDDILLPPETEDIREHLSVKYSFPTFIIDIWKKAYGLTLCEEILKASSERAPVSIRVNLMVTDRKTVKELLTDRGFVVSEGRFSERSLLIEGGGSASGLTECPEYMKGMFAIQDEGSILAADALGACAGETVVDVCAAPGGKTAAIGEMMKDNGTVAALDIYRHKLKLIRQQADKAGLHIIKTEIADGRTGIDGLDGKADRVLADVPCSGLGVIRRKPEIKYRPIENMSSLVELQRQILSRSSRYLKPGGTLVYSTCTINPAENQEQIEYFLRHNKKFSIISQRQCLPTEGIDGFFICKMIKEG